MKKVILPAALLAALLCTGQRTFGQKSAASAKETKQRPYFGGGPISVPRANEMIGAYLSTGGSGTTHSLFIDADTLRKYLSDTKIRGVKFFLARPASSGKAIDSSGITLVIAGIGERNDYVLTPEGTVYNEVRPCPTECPDGQAGSDLIPED